MIKIYSKSVLILSSALLLTFFSINTKSESNVGVMEEDSYSLQLEYEEATKIDDTQIIGVVAEAARRAVNQIIGMPCPAVLATCKGGPTETFFFEEHLYASMDQFDN